MKRSDLIVRLMSGIYGLHLSNAEVVADYIIMREEALLAEIEKPLNRHKIFSSPKMMCECVYEALQIIDKARGK